MKHIRSSTKKEVSETFECDDGNTYTRIEKCDGLDHILSPGLRNDILSLIDDVFEMTMNYSTVDVERHLHSKYVFGVDGPICISDIAIVGNSDLDNIKVFLSINYKITYCYEPIQDLDTDLVLSFDVNKETRRDKKINSILNK